jgi:hypothetical protein
MTDKKHTPTTEEQTIAAEKTGLEKAVDEHIAVFTSAEMDAALSVSQAMFRGALEHVSELTDERNKLWRRIKELTGDRAEPLRGEQFQGRVALPAIGICGLLPCPFCGGDPYFNNYDDQAAIFCGQCSVRIHRCHESRGGCGGIKEVKDAWNRRTASAASYTDTRT